MKAIILAAGYGNRMKPLTDVIHKTLLEVAGKTIIERIIDGLIDNNVNEIVVVTGYKAEDLKKYLSTHYVDVKFEYVHNERYRETNNIFSLALAFEEIKIDKDILIIESDLIYDSSIIRKIINSSNQNVALVDKYRSGMDGTVVSISDGIITNVIPPHLQGDNFDFSDKYKTLNIYKFSKEFSDDVFKKLLTYYAKVINDNCYYELMLGILIYMQQETIFAEIVEEEIWTEVDDVNDLRIAEFVFNKPQRKEILENAWGGYWNYDIVDFCFIRNMHFPTHSIIAEIKNNFVNLLHNYGSKNSIVNKKLSNYLLLNDQRVVALNGAAQIYPFIQMQFGHKKALIPRPTFGEYDKIFSDPLYYYDEPGVDLDCLERKVEECDVVVFVNPNNPTGTIINTEKIIKVIKSNPRKFFIIDESFLAFSEEKSITSFIEKDEMNNVLVLTSMSKTHGFPGLRLGHCYSSDLKLIQEINDWLPIWNFNSFAEFTLEVLLKNRPEYLQSIAKTNIERDEFKDLFSKQSWVETVYESGANFILIKLKRLNEDNLINWLLNIHGVFIKSVSNKFNDDYSYFRLAVRMPEENKKLVSMFKIFLEND